MKFPTTKCRAPWIAAALLISVSVGCGGADKLKVYPVKGRVNFDGKPLSGGGSIAFVPVDNVVGKAAGGEIKADGTFELTTYREGDGSMPGDFRVVVMQTTVKEPEASKDGEKPTMGPVSVVPETDRIPAVYADHRYSPLTAKVEAKTPNEIDFELKREPGGQ